MRKQDKLPENLGLGLTVAGIVAGVVLIMTSWLLWVIPYPVEYSGYWKHLGYWAAWRIDGVLPFLSGWGQAYQAFLDRIGATYPSWWLSGRFDFAAVLAFAGGGWAGFQAGKAPSAIAHIVGRRLWTGHQARHFLKAIARKECTSSGEGISMHSDFQWCLALDRENRHFLILGSIGSGKTVVIIPLVQAAMARDDKLVIYDNKGDFTRWLPQGVLFAPWDTRSSAWDIGKDCINKQDAIELASRLIPEGQDPLWHTAARQILVAIILRLRRYQGGSWGWKELYQQACLPRDELLAIIESELPEARHVVAAPEKTSQSILVNFGAHMTLLADLAAAWGDMPFNKRFSFREWLDDDHSKQRVLVLQGSGQYAQLAKGYIQAIVSLMAGHINSPAFPESTMRRVWFILDEFPQLGKMEQVAPLLEIGRSKGIRVVLGAQDLEQIKALYGDHAARSWMSMIGTQVILRINPGETANFLSKDVIGYRTIDRTLIEDGKQRTLRENVLVVEPSELESELGKDGKGVTGLVLGYGDVFQLHWPFTDVKSRRAPTVPSAWLSGSGPNKPIPLAFLRNVEDIPSSASPSTNPTPAAEAKTNDQPSPVDTLTLQAGTPSRQGKRRLVLRIPTQEVQAMASTGCSIVDAAEPFDHLKTEISSVGEA